MLSGASYASVRGYGEVFLTPRTRSSILHLDALGSHSIIRWRKNPTAAIKDLCMQKICIYVYIYICRFRV